MPIEMNIKTRVKTLLQRLATPLWYPGHPYDQKIVEGAISVDNSSFESLPQYGKYDLNGMYQVFFTLFNENSML